MFDYFSYNSGPPEIQDKLRISPSQLSKFFDATPTWYRENMLGEELFKGSTSTVLGTAVHAGAEMLTREGVVHYQDIENYVRQASQTIPDIDTSFVLDQYSGMINTVAPAVTSSPIAEVEKYVYYEIVPGVVVGGTIDAILGAPTYYADGKEVNRSDFFKAQMKGVLTSTKYTKPVTIRDWKTTSQKSPVKSFSRPYWFQQMTYAWILDKLGINVYSLELQYVTVADINRASETTGKPLKDYPSITYNLPYLVTSEDMDIIDSTLRLVAQSMLTFQQKPELRHLLAQDMRLAESPPPRLFI